MFARVAPLIKTPPGADQFDYHIPDGMTVAPGDAIIVPFRRRPIPAIIFAICANSPFADRALPITRVYDQLHFPKSFLELVTWQAARSFTSRSAILKAWLRILPKRPSPSIRAEFGRTKLTFGSLHETWSVHPQSDIVRAARLAMGEGERVLILTPWKTRADEYRSSVTGSRLLHGDLSDGQAFYAWQSFLTGETRCLIATRIGAWLSCVADRVLVDEPENDDHKQDELAPRYDARLIAAWCGTNAASRIETFGVTPSFVRAAVAPTITMELSVLIRHPQGRSAIPMVQADTLARLRDHDGPRIVIHPIRGLAARLVCRDCGWRATCPSCGFGLSAEDELAACRHCGKRVPFPTTCPSCGGSDLGKSWPGIETLKRAWQKNEPYLAVEWRDLSNEKLEAPFPKNALIVLTDGSLLGSGEDVRRAERRLIAFRRLSARIAETDGAALIVQTEEAQAAAWTAWLSGDGVRQFYEQENRLRQTFGYPPAARLVKVLMDGDETAAEQWKERAAALAQGAAFRGPFLIPFHRASRHERRVWHLLYPRDTKDDEIIRQLSPLAGSAIIDLDPVAFFR